MSKIKPISTLEFYNYGEQNNFQAANGISYKVKVSDKEGNIITLEKDGSLFAMVGLSLENNVLSLIDKAHDDSTIAEVEFPNAGHIDNCHFDADNNKIVFDIVTLNGEVETVELDVESLVDVYEAGQGIEISDKNAETGKKSISIKLANGEDILQLSDEGLSISDKIATDEEVEEAISGKADTSYVDELFGSLSGITDSLSGKVDTIDDEIEKIKRIIGTEDDDPDLDERIDSKADLEEFNDLENEVGELEATVNTISADTEALKEKVEGIEDELSGITESIDELKSNVNEISGNVDTLSGSIETIETEIEDNKTKIVKVTSGLDANIKESYHLENNLGEILGETINIYNESSLVNVELVNEDDQGHVGKFIKFTYMMSDGTEKIVYVNLTDIIPNVEFKDGLQKDEQGNVSVKIDPLSDGYLSVSEEGILLSGITEFLNALAQTDQQQWAVINQNRADLEAVDAQQWQAINDEITNRTNAVNALQSAITEETSARISGDTELQAAIETEKAERIAADNAISGSIDSKVATETERAMNAESAIANNLNLEISRATNAENNLDTKINSEIIERKGEDLAIRSEIANKYDVLDNKIDSVHDEVEDERAERIAGDNALSGAIDDVKATYATKTYVDEQDANAIDTAIYSGKAYTDEVKNELKQYCDDGHNTLQNAISENATKINVISNLRGVSGDDSSHYDDSGNGILDVLHREFHAFTASSINTGEGIVTTNPNEVGIGRYNVSNQGTLFSVGNGTSDENRSNALEVRDDGSLWLMIEGDYMNVNDLLAQIAHEVY